MSRFCFTLVLVLFAAGCRTPGGGLDTSRSPAAGEADAVRKNLSLGERGPHELATVDTLVLRDTKRGKDLPLRITYPLSKDRHPLIVWSHGAGGSKDNYQPLVTHWVSHGFVVIQPTHSDSRALGMKAGDPSRFQDWPSRPADMSFVLDSLDEVENRVPVLAGRIERGAIGVGGHSFGANTAQLVGGATAFPAGRSARSYADARATAVMLLSGQGVGEMLRRESWQEFRRPMLVMSGSADGPTRTGQPAVWRKQPYELSPPGDKFLVWVEGLDHGYGGATGAEWFNPRNKPNANHVVWTQVVTLAFWRAYLQNDAAARAWLLGNGLAAMSNNAATIEHK